MLGIKHNIPKIRSKLERLKKLVSEEHPNVQDDFMNLVEKAQRQVKRLTPRSEGGPAVKKAGKTSNEHIANGWTIRRIGGTGKDRVPCFAILYNRFTHKQNGEVRAGARLPGKCGVGKREYSLLEVLEYGSPAHPIDPCKAKFLHFVGDDGEEVFTKHVDHPGTKPYGMVRVTNAKAQYWMQKLLRRWERRVEGDWRRG